MATSPLWDRTKPLYKYVDACDAHYLEAGSIKIGTFRSYAKLESSRQDTDENIFRYDLPTLDMMNPDDNALARSFGFEVNNCNVEFRGNVSNIVGPNHYCICTSYRDDLPEEILVPQAVFRIENVDKWMDRIVSLHRHIGTYVGGLVEYGIRGGVPTHGQTPTVDPFIKPERYAHEHEVRFVSSKPCAEDAQPIYGAADEELAALMERIR